MKNAAERIDALPVATLVHLIVTVVLGIDLLLDSKLSDDALTYGAFVMGGNGLVAIGRGLKKRGGSSGDTAGAVVETAENVTVTGPQVGGAVKGAAVPATTGYVDLDTSNIGPANDDLIRIPPELLETEPQTPQGV